MRGGRATSGDEKTIDERASRAILGPNPFLGFRAEDVLAAAGALAREAVTAPALVVEQQAAVLRDRTRLLAGRSELVASKDDERFTDPAWRDDPF